MSQVPLRTDVGLDVLLGLPEGDLEQIYDGILQTLPSRAPIYLPTERINLVDRILGVRHVHQIYQDDLDTIYRPRLRALRERYKGHQRCFLIGNGPSLNETDLDVLKDEITFAVNGFFLKSRDLDWTPTFYLVEDHLVAEDRAPWINALKGPIKLFPAYLGYVFSASDDTIFYNHRPRKSFPHGFDFSLEADKITYTGCTVTFSMMQLAAYLGFQEIYLIGVDASYSIPSEAQKGTDYSVGILDMKSDDPNHFDPNYFGKGFRWHDPQVDKMIEAYSEARRTLEGTDQSIYNATVGGQLEIFERRSYHTLFPQARSPAATSRANQDLQNSKYPRLLIIDMTAIGNGTATGEVKAALLADWPKERLLQVSRNGRDVLALTSLKEAGVYENVPAQADAVREAVEDFGPDVILYRMVPKVPFLHKFAMQIIQRLNRPLVTWLMDDWPTHLAHSDPDEWLLISPDLFLLLESSALHLSICDSMSVAFQARYGKKFTAIANGVNPVEWPALRHHKTGCLLLRYSGGLAKNMSLDSVLRIARAVELLAKQGHNISFEINTQAWWENACRDSFQDFEHTSIDCIHRTPEDYRAWLCGADVAVIAYSYDQETLHYVQYSMANKMPECLASGAVVFAHGPRSIATIDYLFSTEAAVVVEEPMEEAIASSLLALLENPAQRNALARQGRKHSFEHHNVVNLREDFRSAISATLNSGSQAGISFHGTSASVASLPAVSMREARLEMLDESHLANKENKRLGNLRLVNQIMRQGKYQHAIKEYIALWQSIADPGSPIAQAIAFNSLYCARRLGINRVKTMDEIVRLLHK
jgi:glycosyltransferase involved in cell wall biosynthesis